MSIPPQLIRVKRKRVVEETPVTFLQFDGSQKRHRSRHWAYQRRDPEVVPTPKALSDKPVIHVSRPQDASPPTKKHHGAQSSLESIVSRSSSQTAKSGLPEPRRFHVSRSTLAASRSQAPKAVGISKKERYTPAIFVERSRKKKTPKPRRSLAALQAAAQQLQDESRKDDQVPSNAVEQKQLKRPSTTKKARDAQKDAPTRAPLPASLMNRHNEDMDKIALDMNQWVLNEIGANLHSMEQEKEQSGKAKFKPKAPTKRYQERHPELAPAPQADEPMDVIMSDASEDEGDDNEWIIEEYVRIPANTVALDVSPSDIGVLVLDDEEENMLFFGPSPDEDDDLDEDDEDENAENHYTADYPEDEVESDDEYGRRPYGYRNGNASDDEEFGDVHYSDNEDGNYEALFKSDADDDDDADARMARIRAYMKRNSAFQ
ncbi:hypothetical protein TOPH_00508 [Tolypocladium ophioglossoides CBS 100239]|uniref:Transcription factor Iwr1 domain-containing protein n=1 Tax=Tolypocladium ophioglossoides (strain CBS 100239) TaxID=1163406 RepID=A0A0L0NLD8_TOLOC|nr:hypothetical protein TOPH_00508 [Tolypocladium ophioglossoides CBS 100239]